MPSGQKLTTAQLLYKQAQHMGLQPSWVTPNGLFAVSVAGREKYVNSARSSLNSHSSISLATNKYLTRMILERHNMWNIPFARPRSQAEAVMFLKQHSKVIAKPINGAGSRDIHIITSADQLQTLHITAYILEKYIAGQELRYLVLGEEVIGVYHSDYGLSVAAARSLECIAQPKTAWDPALTAEAIKTAHILGLTFGAVDYLIAKSGRPYILEVNTAPDLQWFHAPTSGPSVDVARQLLEAMFDH